MTLLQRMQKGYLYYEHGHASKEEKSQEKKLDELRLECKEILYDYNLTRPREVKERGQLLKDLFHKTGKEVFIETPLHAAYGVNTSIGDCFYANFNLVLVDDGKITIGNHVMLAPNVTITTTGHPVWPEYRKKGTQFSLPIMIEDGVWIGSNVVILPGVTIGRNSVIGAGSVVTKDIPENVVAFGQPCKVVRTITRKDKFYYMKNAEVDEEFLEDFERILELEAKQEEEKEKKEKRENTQARHFLK